MAPRRFVAAALSLGSLAVHAEQDGVISQRPIHAAFVAPPLSHYTCMLPISHALLDAGHTITFIGYEETIEKIRELYDQRSDAHVLTGDGRLHYRVLTRDTKDDDELHENVIRKMQSMPYWGNQLFSMFSVPIIHNRKLSTPLALEIRDRANEILLLDSPQRVNVLSFFSMSPSLFGMAEAMDIPSVGINGLAGYSILGDVYIDAMPWSARPNFAMFVRQEDMHKGSTISVLSNISWNLLVRLISIGFLLLGSLLNSIDRYQLGHPSPIDTWEFSFAERHPVITPYVTEFMIRSPPLVPLHSYNIGIVDHPAMEGQTMRKSQQTDGIIKWLDSHCKTSPHDQEMLCDPVYYFSLGSEVFMTHEMSRFFAETFRSASFSILWANKIDPHDAVNSFPETIYYTKFAPQIAVLSHPAVIGFFSHGGFNSISEAIVRKVPMVIMPFFGDQMGNALELQSLGNSIVLRKDLIWSYTAKKKRGLNGTRELAAVQDAMLEIAGQKYQKRAQFLSNINAQRRNLDLAVEVFELAARREFDFSLNSYRPSFLLCSTMFLIFVWGVKVLLGLFSCTIHKSSKRTAKEKTS